MEVDGADARTNVWSHGFGTLTFLPRAHKPDNVDSANPRIVEAFIEIVWPHDSNGQPRPAAEAGLLNLAVDLYHHPIDVEQWYTAKDEASSLGFDFSRPVRLLRTLNDGFLEPVKTVDQRITATSNFAPMISWPRWVFNDVDVSAARDPLNRYYFVVQVDGVETHTTIWSHGADARTYFPEKDVPARSCAT